ncbi:unnamed protein product [Amoebophrya sp. A25]|nr:unnamed protein product [Amoebophrya sp. A25]|eukprot:GSA25T00008427001.1
MPSQRNCVKKLKQAVVVGALSSGTCNYAYAYQKIRQSKNNDNQEGPPHDHDESETTRKPCRGNLRGGKEPCDDHDSARSAHTDEAEIQEDVLDETATVPTAFMVTEAIRTRRQWQTALAASRGNLGGRGPARAQRTNAKIAQAKVALAEAKKEYLPIPAQNAPAKRTEAQPQQEQSEKAEEQGAPKLTEEELLQHKIATLKEEIMKQNKRVEKKTKSAKLKGIDIAKLEVKTSSGKATKDLKRMRGELSGIVDGIGRISAEIATSKQTLASLQKELENLQ